MGFKEKARKGDSSTLIGDGTRQSKLVVAIDFGTTYSGAAFAKLTDLESGGTHHDDGIQLHDKWPGQAEAGAKSYCKTQTSVWYMPGPKPGTFELKGWGWKGYLAYKDRCAGMTMNESMGQQSTADGHSEINSSSRLSARSITELPHKCGYFIKNFKLGLDGIQQDLPHGLTIERVTSDFLRELTSYIKEQTKDGTYAASPREIQYVMTVPAMWTLQTRQRMQSCAEMAGMVGGLLCKDSTAASLHDLIMVPEPEAAAVQVYKSLKTVGFTNGNRFLVVDVGGGTTDIIVHEKIGSTTRKNYMRVKEVSASEGIAVGGIHVDEKFDNFMSESIGCFSSFQKKEPRQILEVNRYWNDIKCNFNGDQNNLAIPIPGKLARAWKRFDRDTGSRQDGKDYDYLKIGREGLQRIFDPVVEKILTFIQRRLVSNLRAILVVGGFSESPYLQERIKKAFNGTTETIFMRNAGSAVVRGAVLYGVTKEWINMVSVRIAPKTIGWDVAERFTNKKHRRGYLVSDDYKQTFCDNIFGVLIRKGQEIPVNYVHTVFLKPLYRRGREDGDDIELNLYESRTKSPRYVTDKGVRKLATCCFSVPRKESLGRTPKFKLSVHFGTLIKASVMAVNFSGQTVRMSPVKMKWLSPDEV